MKWRFHSHIMSNVVVNCEQVKSRVAFGKPLVQQGTILQDIAESRIEIEQARWVIKHKFEFATDPLFC